MEDRVRVLASVSDALFPPLKNKALLSLKDGDELSAQLYSISGGVSDELILKAVQAIETRLTPESRRDLNLLLRLLGSRWGSLLVLGFQGTYWGLPTAFVDLPRERREAVLLQWATSPQEKLRKAFKGLKAILMSTMFGTLSPEGGSPLLSALRYPVVDPGRPPAPIPQALAAEQAVAGACVDLSPADSSPGGVASAGAALVARGLSVVWPDKVRNAAIKAQRPHLVLKCDAVVVGSGAGGGVAAAQLAAAGLRVVVLEKAGMVAAQDMTLREGEAFQAMYENGGLLSTEDGALSVLAGSTVGGGTRINWCASFRTPPHVRREWAEALGLPDFGGPKYDRALDAVCSRLSVHTGFHHSGMCSALAGGLQQLGVHCGEVPRNCLSAECSGHCGFGCARGYKQDVLNTFLADACRQGGRVITGVWADRVVTETNSKAPGGIGGGVHKKKRAVGVLALAGDAERPLRLVVKAPVVVSSAGSLHSPALLLRSGVKCRGNVGANLRLHPCTCVVGLFPPDQAADAAAARPGGTACGGGGTPSGRGQDLEDWGKGREAAAVAGGASGGGSFHAASDQGLEAGGRKLVMSAARHGPGTINCWEGALMTIFSNQVAHWEESGYGALLYTPSIHPALFSVAAPWLGGEDFKDLLLQFNNQCTVLVLVRDQGAGRVVIDSRGLPRLEYRISPEDQSSMVEGMELALRSMAAAGATEVLTLQPNPDARFSFGGPGAVSGTSPDGSRYTAARGGSAGKAQAAADVAQRGDGCNGGEGGAGEGRLEGLAGGNAEFEGFLRGVRGRGIPHLEMPLFSAHQMGTCRLGSDPKSSVLDPQGECWEVAGLYCCDGSTFPTPTGLNPMITIESISYMLAEGIAERAVAALKRRGKWKGRTNTAGGGSGRGVVLVYESVSQARL